MSVSASSRVGLDQPYLVRFGGWQHTSAGDREIQRALRRTLLNYELHREQELFDRTYGYIRRY